MKKVISTIDHTEIPEGTRFSANWIYDNTVWADTFKFVDGVCYCYNSDSDSWAIEGLPHATVAPFTGNYVTWFTYIG